MTRLSVRARLTGLVMAVTLVIGIVAATLGVNAIESQLVDDELDAAGTAQLSLVAELAEFTDVAFAGEFDDDKEADKAIDDEFDEFFVDEFIVQDELENLTFSLIELIDAGSLDALVSAAPQADGGAIPILTYFGKIVLFDPATLTLDGPTALATVDDAVVVPQSTIDELLFLTVEVDLEDVFDFDLDDDVADEIAKSELADGDAVDSDDLEFSLREFAGVEYVVVADVSGIGRGLDRIRSIVWLILPILVLLGGVVAWLLVGRSLRPVHAMTRRVGEISSGNLHERVPEPGTGDEIAELAATMNSMLDRLEVGDRRLRRFVSDASHELRSPVAVLRSEAEIARRSLDDTTVEELADGVLEESERLQSIVEDLLVLARGEERQAQGRASEIDVDDVVLAEARRRRQLAVDTSGVSAGRIVGTRDAVERVVTHLLDNAARHGTSRVLVALGAESGEVVLRVDDDGPGIATEDRARVFERFTRLDDARTRDRGGAGLGLAVVAESVRAMGGQVRVEDSPLGGASFVVSWPAEG